MFLTMTTYIRSKTLGGMVQTKHTVFALINPEPNCEKEVEETMMAVS